MVRDCGPNLYALSDADVDWDRYLKQCLASVEALAAEKPQPKTPRFQAGQSYTGKGTLATVWTGPCPHANPDGRVVPDDNAPDWVKAMVAAKVSNHDNGIDAGLRAGEYWLVNGSYRAWGPAWTPKEGKRQFPAFGYECRTIQDGDEVTLVRVNIEPEREPIFPLPRVKNIPGWGLDVVGPRVTTSERGVPAHYSVEVLQSGIAGQ